MISQVVEVVESRSNYLVLEPREAGCQACTSGSCGVTNFAHLFGKRSHQLKVPDSGEFQVGDTVELLLDESLFLRSVIVQYLLPLICMFLFVFLVTLISQELVFQLLGAIIGIGIGILISRFTIRWYEYCVDGEHLKIRQIPSQ